MAEYFPGVGPDFSSLAEKPSPSPEKKPDDDDDDQEVDPGARRSPLFERPKQAEKNPEKTEDNKHEKKAEKPEMAVPLESLAADEKRLVGGEIVKNRAEDIGNELEAAPADTVAEKEALVAATFYEVLAEKMEAGEPVEQAIDSSAKDTLDMTGLEVPEVDDLEDAQPRPENTIIDPEAIPDVDTPEDQDDPIPAASVTPTGSAGSAPPSLPAVGLPGATIPPLPPIPPIVIPTGGYTGPGGPGSGGPSPFGGGILPPTPNILSPSVPEVVNDRRHVGRYFLAGGIIGYMIGRRRGRIKTEKRLLPIQKKLEGEVTALEQKIISREEKIRSLVREQLAQKPELSTKIVERLRVLQELKPKVPAEKLAARPIVDQPEKLGKFAMIAEQPLPVPELGSSEHATLVSPTFESLRPELSRPETLSPERPLPQTLKTPEAPRAVELMTKAELLIVAERISFEQSNLKRLFEANRLNDQGLRRIVRAYLRGERLEHVISDNLIGREKYSVAAETLQSRPDNSQPQSAGGGILPPISPAMTRPAEYDSAETPRPTSSESTGESPQPIKQNPHTKLLPAAIIIIAIIFLILMVVR